MSDGVSTAPEGAKDATEVKEEEPKLNDKMHRVNKNDDKRLE